MKNLFMFLCTVGLLASCSQPFTPAVSDLAKNTVESLSCNDFKSTVWDGVKTYLLEQDQIPKVFEISSAIQAQLKQLKEANPQITQDDINILALDLDSLFKALLEESAMNIEGSSAEQLLSLLSGIDVGDRTTAFRSYMVDKTKALFEKVNADIQNLGINCPRVEASEPALTFERHQLESLQAGQNLAVFGQRWAFATAYQSCNALRIPAMTTQTPAVDGIKIVGKYSDGVGSVREIASLSDLLRTHVYIKDERQYNAGCFDLRKSPLIYDYGGKPYATTSTSSPIDFFTNRGGAKVLGIDCSGYVFSAMATAGLKLKKGRALKASDAWAWGSSSYLDPQRNGLTCLDKIKVDENQSLMAGDIVAIRGHVFMIDSIGVDPFGITKTKAVSDCDKMDAKNFDFVVSQSSNSKNGIGINRYQARDFVPEKGEAILPGFLKYATYACQAYYNKKSYTPSVGILSVVRHNGTKECMAPRVKLSREECISTCSDLVK